MNWTALAEQSVGFIVGLLIGTVLGFIAKDFCEARRTSNQKRERSVRKMPWNQLALFLVVLVTVYAAIAAGNSSVKALQSANRSNEAVAQNQRLAMCSQVYLFRTISALNDRTEFSTQAAEANIDLIRAQTDFIRVALQPPIKNTKKDHAIRVAALKKYFRAQNRFLDLTAKSTKRANEHPYPTKKEYGACLTRADQE